MVPKMKSRRRQRVRAKFFLISKQTYFGALWSRSTISMSYKFWGLPSMDEQASSSKFRGHGRQSRQADLASLPAKLIDIFQQQVLLDRHCVTISTPWGRTSV